LAAAERPLRLTNMARLAQTYYLAAALVCLLAAAESAAQSGAGTAGAVPSSPVLRLPPISPTAPAYGGGGVTRTAGTRVFVFQELPEHGDTARLWWQPLLAQPQRAAAAHHAVTVQQLVLDALKYSLRVQALRQPVHVAAEEMIQAQADFDARGFMESRFLDLNEPVGSTLATGGPSRLMEHNWEYKAGVRKRTAYGGTWEAAQELGHKNSNSLFFVPQDQGSAQLVLNFTQPLLNGAGRAYNESLIVLAGIDSNLAGAAYAKELQDYLVIVADAYWQLYYQRGLLLLKRRHLERAQRILDDLRSRLDIDTLQSQIVRASAAIATRRTELARAEAAVLNVEAQLRALTNAPQYQPPQPELLPVETPLTERVQFELGGAVQTALTHRPEIDEATQQVRAACVRLDMSHAELLPTLSLVLETYANGLAGESSVGSALERQFSRGSPSYSAGLLFETPLYNRAAQSRLRQREAQRQQVILDFHALVETLSTEVEIAVRDVETAFREMAASYAAMAAVVTNVRYLSERWDLLPGDDRSAGLFLEDMLAAQDRLVDEESAFLQSQVEYARAIIRLKRAMGTLVDVQAVPPSAVETDEAVVEEIPAAR